MINRFQRWADSCDEKIAKCFNKLIKKKKEPSTPKGKKSTPFIHFFLTDVGKALWDSLDNPDDWEYGESGSKYTIVHKSSGIALWIANGSWFLDGYNELVFGKPRPPKVEIGLFERHILWRRVNSIKKSWNKKAAEQKAAVDMLRNKDV